MVRICARTETLGLAIGLVVAATAFSLLFTGVVFHFWAQLALSVLALTILFRLFDPSGFAGLFRPPARIDTKAVALGLAAAGCLYLIFYVGNVTATALFDFSKGDIADVYRFKGSTPTWVIVLLLLFVIGPGEELFWRGYIQRHLVKRLRYVGFALSILAYTLVHVSAGNVMLILAALVCGFFWAALYLRFKSIWVNIVCHSVWDVAIFVFLPFSTGN